jgi:hypothetical protein
MTVCEVFWISTRAAGRITDVVASLQNSAPSHCADAKHVTLEVEDAGLRPMTIDPISNDAEPIKFAGSETSLDMGAHRKPSNRQEVSQASTARDIRDTEKRITLAKERLSNPDAMCCPETMLLRPQQMHHGT